MIIFCIVEKLKKVKIIEEVNVCSTNSMDVWMSKVEDGGKYFLVFQDRNSSLGKVEFGDNGIFMFGMYNYLKKFLAPFDMPMTLFWINRIVYKKCDELLFFLSTYKVAFTKSFAINLIKRAEFQGEILPNGVIMVSKTESSAYFGEFQKRKDRKYIFKYY